MFRRLFALPIVPFSAPVEKISVMSAYILGIGWGIAFPLAVWIGVVVIHFLLKGLC
jgi:hypothetical protein